jgi:hypothetical protein
MIVPYSNFSTIFKKKNCYLRDLYCEAMKPAAWLLLLAAMANVQCGYRLAGRGRNLPPTARTIAIPAFKNESAEYRAERFVTAALREEFTGRRRLHLSESLEKVDLALTGRISAFATVPVSDSDRGAAGHYQVRVTIDVRLIDMKKNALIYEGNGLVFREPYEAAGGDFFSQESADLAKIAAKFASAVVTTILADW